MAEPAEQALGRLRDYYRERDPNFDVGVKRAETAAHLVDVRREAGLTQVQLAERMGVPQSTIARVERGLTDPRLSTVRAYVQAAGGSLEVTHGSLWARQLGRVRKLTENRKREVTAGRPGARLESQPELNKDLSEVDAPEREALRVRASEADRRSAYVVGVIQVDSLRSAILRGVDEALEVEVVAEHMAKGHDLADMSNNIAEMVLRSLAEEPGFSVEIETPL